MSQLRLALAFGLLCFVSLAQSRKPAPLSAEDVGTRVVAAIRNGDVAPLEALVAPSGLAFGVEEPRISAAKFVGDLKQKRGIYCVLMDSSCLAGAKKDKPDTSLRSLTLRQPIAVQFHPLGDFPERTEVKVVVQAKPSTVLFSVFIERTEQGWRLVRIEYV